MIMSTVAIFELLIILRSYTFNYSIREYKSLWMQITLDLLFHRKPTNLKLENDRDTVILWRITYAAYLVNVAMPIVAWLGIAPFYAWVYLWLYPARLIWLAAFYFLITILLVYFALFVVSDAPFSECSDFGLDW